MSDLHININSGDHQTFDEKRNHLKLHGNLKFSANIKEFSEDFSELLLLTGEEKIARKKELDKKYKSRKDIKKTDEIKDTPIRWVFVRVAKEVYPNKDYSKESVLARQLPFKFTFPSIYIGGGKLWVQPFLQTNGPPSMIRPHGCYVSAYAPPSIQLTLWTDCNNKKIEGPIAYGSRVRLHIYSKHLYGREIEIQLTDRDIFSPNDLLAITENNPEASIEDPIITSQVVRREILTHDILRFEHELGIDKGNFKHVNLGKEESSNSETKGNNSKDNQVEYQNIVQKTSIDLFIDPYWGITAGKVLKIYPVIKIESNGKYLKFNREYLDVRTDAPIYEDPDKLDGNTAVIVGEIETNIRAFDPCRYTEITAGFVDDDTPNTLFSEKSQVNTSSSTINTGVVTNGKNKRAFKIQVKGADTEGCLEDGKIHVDHVIDTSNLDKLILKPEPTHIEGSNPEVSFVPHYPYKYIETGKENFLDFFLDYYPIFNFTGLNIQIPINTCAYNKKINFIVYPDVLFSMHLFIGKNFIKKSKVFFKQRELDMIKGLKSDFKTVNDQRKEVKDIVMKYIPVLMIQMFVMDLIFNYLEDQAEKIAVGFHAVHTIEDKDTFEVLDYSKEYLLLSKAVIVYGMICNVALDALMIYLSGGGSLLAKGSVKAAGIISETITLTKQAYAGYKTFRTVKKIATLNFNVNARPDFSGVEFIMPSLGRSTGIGYETNTEGAVNVVLTERIVASPLLALRYGVKFGLADAVMVLTGVTTMFNGIEVARNIMGEIFAIKKVPGNTRYVLNSDNAPKKNVAGKIGKSKKNGENFLDHIEKSIHKNIKEFFEKIGQKGEVSLYFSGYIDANYEFTIGSDQGLKLDIYDEDGNKKTQQQNKTGTTYGCDYGIAAGVKFNLSSSVTMYWSKLNAYVPSFLLDKPLTDTTASVELDGELGGSMYYENTYTRKGNGAVLQQESLIFTGIRGSIFVKIKVVDKSEEKSGWGYEYGEKPPKDASASVQDKYTEQYTELLEGFTIPFEPKPVFDDSLKKYFIK